MIISEKPKSCQAKIWPIILTLFFLILLSNVECTRQIDKENLIRIHVLANSNTDVDQQLKLQVKDSIVASLEPKLKQSTSIEESRRIICSSLPQIETAAIQTIRQQGYSYNVTLQYGQFDFPVKYYGSFSLPSGNYEALRVLIGQGTGRNWWCVLFPPLCFTDSNISPSGKYTDQIPETDVVIRFKAVEWLKEHLYKEPIEKEKSLTAEC